MKAIVVIDQAAVPGTGFEPARLPGLKDKNLRSTVGLLLRRRGEKENE
jgi:hypothetical protein